MNAGSRKERTEGCIGLSASWCCAMLLVQIEVENLRQRNDNWFDDVEGRRLGRRLLGFDIEKGSYLEKVRRCCNYCRNYPVNFVRSCISYKVAKS